MKIPKASKSKPENIYPQQGLKEQRAFYETDILNNSEIKNRELLNLQNQKDEAFLSIFLSTINQFPQDSNKNSYPHSSGIKLLNLKNESLQKKVINIDLQSNLDNTAKHYEDN